MAHFLRAKLLKSEPAVLGLPLGKLGFAWFGLVWRSQTTSQTTSKT